MFLKKKQTKKTAWTALIVVQRYFKLAIVG